MSVKLTIISEIEKVAQEQGNTLAPLTDDLTLLHSGLDSLGLAILVARLEEILGIDPFTYSDDVNYPETLGDLIKAYADALKQTA